MRRGIYRALTANALVNDTFSTRIRLSVKINDEYRDYKELPPALLAQQGPVGPARPKEQRKAITAGRTLLVLLNSE